ncbi:MAG: helix-turn-helix domain-containing protein [Candidatus Kapabacteria bacterium]|nr:helix-turn-helix domain-containing protein [Candidatus Kapabacteria bacterium]
MPQQPTPSSDPDSTTQSLLLRQIRFTSLLQSLHDGLAELADLVDPLIRKRIMMMLRDIESVVREDTLWSEFVQRYDVIFSSYLSRLSRDFPDLTASELRLCALLRLPMQSKDIATLLHCSVRSIEKHRERIRRKLQLDPKSNLVHFLLTRYVDDPV